MQLSETFKLALAAIWASKLRSALTLLGMVIGITAVVVVVSLIEGFNVYVDERIAGIGAKAFTVQRFGLDDFKDTDTIAAAQRRNSELMPADFEFLRERATLIKQIGLKARAMGAQTKRGNLSVEEVQVSGTSANIAEIENIEAGDGRYFTDAEDVAGARVAFVGADVASDLFPNGAAVGEEISINGLRYRVIGVAKAKGTTFGIPQDNFVSLPLRTYERNFGPLVEQRALSLIATATDDDSFEDAVDEARFLLRARHRLAADEKDDFGIITPDAISGIRDRIFGPIFIVAIAVPAIALVVGGIVIMNIMLVSVTERTKEIGIRKSLGARRRDILKQFLLEAVTLSAIGGAVGVLLAWILGEVITAVVFPTYLSWLAVVIAVGVSAVIGVSAGVFPAWQAAKLDPIEALRAD